MTCPARLTAVRGRRSEKVDVRAEIQHICRIGTGSLEVARCQGSALSPTYGEYPHACRVMGATVVEGSDMFSGERVMSSLATYNIAFDEHGEPHD
jgi:hypothetical protein